MKGQGKKYGFPTDNPLAKDTHTVFLNPFSVCEWQKIMNNKEYKNVKHKVGKFYDKIGEGWFEEEGEAGWAKKKPKLTELTLNVMPKMMLPGSCKKTYDEQKKMVPKGYIVCGARNLIGQVCLLNIQTGEISYGENDKKYTVNSQLLPFARTKTRTAARVHVFVGPFDAAGLNVYVYLDDSRRGHVGVGVARRNS